MSQKNEIYHLNWRTQARQSPGPVPGAPPLVLHPHASFNPSPSLLDSTLPLNKCKNASALVIFNGRRRQEQASWEEHDTFKETLRLSEGRPEFTFYDGPPFATGLPHYGHILAGEMFFSTWYFSVKMGSRLYLTAFCFPLRGGGEMCVITSCMAVLVYGHRLWHPCNAGPEGAHLH